jgi:hypothetical protein
MTGRLGTQRFLGERTHELLANTPFRRLYTGHAVSKVGDELYFVAAMWLVYVLTGSSLFTGITAFLARFPGAIGFLVGPLVDRSPLGRLLVSAESIQAVVVAIVPVAWLLDWLSVWLVLGVVGTLALLERFSGPAQNAAIPRLVDDRNLLRANSLAAAGDRAIGASAQAVGGGLIALFGAVALFALNAVTFVVSGLCFALTAIPSTEKSGTVPSVREYIDDIQEGVQVLRESVVGHMLVGAALAGAFTGMTTAVLPAFADSFGGAGTYGLLLASMTVGTFCGTLLASRLETVPFGQVTAGGFFIAALCWGSAIAVAWPPVTLALFGLAFIPVGVYNVLVSATLQSGVPETLLGRVTSTVGSVTAVVGPTGMLVGGGLGDVLGSRTVVLASAVGFALLGSYWLAVPALRRFPPVDGVEPGSFGIQQT